MEQSVEQRKKGFLDRQIRLKWPAYFIIALIVLGFVLYGIHMWQIASLRGQARNAVQDEIRKKGESLAQTLATVGRDTIFSSDYEKQQDYFNSLVKMPETDLQYLIVMKMNGEAVVHTNSKYAGKKLDDKLAKKALGANKMVVTDVPSQNLYDIAVPVMGFTAKAAVVRVGISYARSKRVLSP